MLSVGARSPPLHFITTTPTGGPHPQQEVWKQRHHKVGPGDEEACTGLVLQVLPWMDGGNRCVACGTANLGVSLRLPGVLGSKGTPDPTAQLCGTKLQFPLLGTGGNDKLSRPGEQQQGIDTPVFQRRALIGCEGRQSRAGSHWAQARKSCGCVVAVGSATAIFKSVASGAQRARQLRLLSPCFGPLARAGAARAVLSAQRALRRPDVDGPAPCSAAPSSRRACGGGTDLVPRPRTAASHPLGSRCGTRLSRVSRGGRRAALDPDLEPLPRTDFRELGREAAPAVADLQWRVQSGPYLRGEGDGDSPPGWKVSTGNNFVCLKSTHESST
nr:uncharacterized protein LOC108394214 [Manis javanica]